MSVDSENNRMTENWLHPDVQSVFSIFCNNMKAIGGFETCPRLLVAVSGGVDSMALCLLADQWAKHHKGSMHAAIVDHGLRANSAEEAAYVSNQLDKLHIPNSILTWRGQKPQSAVQEVARQVRYSLLEQCAEQIGALHMILGHHADDQRETVKMRLARSSDRFRLGQAGMAAVSYRDQVRVLRPLLNISKLQLQSVCLALGQSWVNDPTNQSDKYERNRVRREIEQQSHKKKAEMDEQIARAQNENARSQREIAAVMVNYVRLSPMGFAWVDSELFESDVTLSVLQECLSRVVQCIGGQIYAPAQSSVLQLMKDRSKPHTLGGCEIRPYKQGILILRELPRAGHKNPDDGRFVGGKTQSLTVAKDIQRLQLWLKIHSRGENLPNPSIIRRFPVELSDDDGCLVPRVGYSAVCSRASGETIEQKSDGIRFSPPKSLTYCLGWLAPAGADIIS